MTKVEEQRVLRAITAQYGIELDPPGLNLNGWGNTDIAVHVKSRCIFVVEVETSQKHPCTNVLKLWPYLENHRDTAIVLVQVFGIGARNLSSNRGKLAKWVGKRMAAELPEQFRYCLLTIDSKNLLTEIVGNLDTALAWLRERPN